jgi:hypothetical protein
MPSPGEPPRQPAGSRCRSGCRAARGLRLDLEAIRKPISRPVGGQVLGARR